MLVSKMLRDSSRLREAWDSSDATTKSWLRHWVSSTSKYPSLTREHSCASTRVKLTGISKVSQFSHHLLWLCHHLWRLRLQRVNWWSQVLQKSKHQVATRVSYHNMTVISKRKSNPLLIPANSLMTGYCKSRQGRSATLASPRYSSNCSKRMVHHLNMLTLQATLVSSMNLS